MFKRWANFLLFRSVRKEVFTPSSQASVCSSPFIPHREKHEADRQAGRQTDKEAVLLKSQSFVHSMSFCLDSHIQVSLKCLTDSLVSLSGSALDTFTSLHYQHRIPYFYQIQKLRWKMTLKYIQTVLISVDLVLLPLQCTGAWTCTVYIDEPLEAVQKPTYGNTIKSTWPINCIQDRQYANHHRPFMEESNI